ncbi:MAG: hypothetical protein KF761_13140 [Salinibacterium sp.]|nr:hypothetical protein [Salinibacterium sp.]
MSETRRRRRWPWIVGGILAVILVPVGILVFPILTHQNQGVSHQSNTGVEWPTSVTAKGDDGRTRVLSVASSEPGGTVDTSALMPGERLVVTGSGYDGSRGIYVAICVIPDDPATKPGPCIGGVPDQVQETVEAGAVQYAPSNWINDDWAWRLFGARSYDNVAEGTFTAYIEVGDPHDAKIDCTVQACGLFTRNDHTALSDRVQDLYIPVAFG